MTMIPTVGRIIHVKDAAYPEEDNCLAAIVTGVNYGPTVPAPVAYLAIWGKYGAMRATLMEVNSPNWHDPKECPQLPIINEFLKASDAALGVAANL